MINATSSNKQSIPTTPIKNDNNNTNLLYWNKTKTPKETPLNKYNFIFKAK